MRRIVVLSALLASAPCCKKSPQQAQAQALERAEKICKTMSDLSLAYVAGLVEIEVESIEDPATRTKLREACRALPPEVVECASRLALDDVRCDEALEKYLGMTDTTPQGSGPAPSWELAAPFDVYDLEVSAAGRVALAGDKGLAVVADGAVAWTTELEDFGSRVGWWKDCTLAGVKGELRCYDSAGEVAWAHRLTEDDVWLSAIEPGPKGRVIVVDSKGTIVHIDGDQCAAGSPGCATTIGTVEALGGMQVAVLPSGAILGSNDDGIALVSAKGALLARKAASYEASAPGRGLIVAGTQVLRANPGCEAGADDCFEVAATAKDLELTAPTEVPGVGVAYADTYGVIHLEGEPGWKIDAGNDGDLVSDGTTLYSVGHVLGLGEALEEPPQVRAIDPKTGKTRWITKLGTKRAGMLSGYIMVHTGKDLVVATPSHVFWVPLGDR